MLTCSKTYRDLPFAHRQHRHDGHCQHIHGHNWAFTFTFAADKRDENGFVVDFGKLKHLKQWLKDRFDHTLVLNEDDPWLDHLYSSLDESTSDVLDGSLAKILVVPDGSSEGIALWLFDQVRPMVHAMTGGRARLRSVRVQEDSRNEAFYQEEHP